MEQLVEKIRALKVDIDHEHQHSVWRTKTENRVFKEISTIEKTLFLRNVFISNDGLGNLGMNKVRPANGVLWNRYIDGDILYDVVDEKSANDINSYVSDLSNDLTVDETHKFFNFVMKGLLNIESEKIVQCEKPWLRTAELVDSILKEARENLVWRWTNLMFAKCGSENHKNEAVFVLEHCTLSFWRASAERKGKIIFFPNIHIEIVPFLQSIRVIQHYEKHMDELQNVLRKYPLEYLYEFSEPEETSQHEDEVCAPDIQIEEQKPKKKSTKKKLNKKGLTNTIEMALKSGKKKQRQKSTLSQRTLLSRSPSVKREEHIKFNLYSDVTPIFKKSATKERTTDGTEHRVDFTTETYLGPIYQISSFESGRRAQKFGSWNVTHETDLEERKLSGESIQVSLKVPVEEVFLGSNEPAVAFRDANSSEWKKGVFTTHTQFDQNTFIVTTRLSKLGYISLFQHNDFHFPYKQWKIDFEKDKILVSLHTSIVELAFVIEGSYFHLDTLTGDEFSKLRNLHQRKMSLSEMIIKLAKHGVHIVPNEEIIKKHRDTKKELDLEIYAYRMICLNQINCESCRMNGTVSMDTIVVTIDGTPRNITTKSPGSYSNNFGDFGKKPHIHTDILTPASLFQFLIATRPIVVTK